MEVISQSCSSSYDEIKRDDPIMDIVEVECNCTEFKWQGDIQFNINLNIVSHKIAESLLYEVVLEDNSKSIFETSRLFLDGNVLKTQLSQQISELTTEMSHGKNPSHSKSNDITKQYAKIAEQEVVSDFIRQRLSFELQSSSASKKPALDLTLNLFPTDKPKRFAGLIVSELPAQLVPFGTAPPMPVEASQNYHKRRSTDPSPSNRHILARGEVPEFNTLYSSTLNAAKSAVLSVNFHSPTRKRIPTTYNPSPLTESLYNIVGQNNFSEEAKQKSASKILSVSSIDFMSSDDEDDARESDRLRLSRSKSKMSSSPIRKKKPKLSPRWHRLLIRIRFRCLKCKVIDRLVALGYLQAPVWKIPRTTMILSSSAFFRHNFKPPKGRKPALVFKSHPVFPSLPVKSENIGASNLGTKIVRPELGFADQGKLEVHQVISSDFQKNPTTTPSNHQEIQSYDPHNAILTLGSPKNNATVSSENAVDKGTTVTPTTNSHNSVSTQDHPTEQHLGTNVAHSTPIRPHTTTLVAPVRHPTPSKYLGLLSNYDTDTAKSEVKPTSNLAPVVQPKVRPVKQIKDNDVDNTQKETGKTSPTPFVSTDLVNYSYQDLANRYAKDKYRHQVRQRRQSVSFDGKDQLLEQAQHAQAQLAHKQEQLQPVVRPQSGQCDRLVSPNTTPVRASSAREGGHAIKSSTNPLTSSLTNSLQMKDKTCELPVFNAITASELKGRVSTPLLGKSGTSQPNSRSASQNSNSGVLSRSASPAYSSYGGNTTANSSHIIHQKAEKPSSLGSSTQIPLTATALNALLVPTIDPSMVTETLAMVFVTSIQERLCMAKRIKFLELVLLV